MRVKQANRDALRGYASPSYSYNGNVTIGAKVLVDMINDFGDIRHALLMMAEEADQRIAEQLERLAAEIAD